MLYRKQCAGMWGERIERRIPMSDQGKLPRAAVPTFLILLASGANEVL